MNSKNILIFICGMIVGGATGILGTRGILSKKYNKQFEECRDELEAYYQRRDEYARKPHEDNRKDRNEMSSKEGVSRPGGRMTPEERASIKEKLRKNYEQTTNYAAMYKASSDKIDPAEMEHPEEEESEAGTCANCGNKENLVSGGKTACYCHRIDDFVDKQDACSDWEPEQLNDQNEVSEEQAFEEHRKNMNKPPKIISAEAYSNLPAHIDQQAMYFYSYDEVLCDENEEMIDEPGLLVGDALTRYDFADSDERCIFVMNYATDTCYEIQKIDASWTDTH